MNGEKTSPFDTFMMYFVLIIACVAIFFVMPFLLVLVVPFGIIALIIWSSSPNYRDEYYHPKVYLLGVVAFVVLFSGTIYFINIDDFNEFNFPYVQDKYVYFGIGLLIINLFLFLYRKNFLPLSFLKESPMFVQQTMYKDYNYLSLKDRFLYRGIKFVDNNFNKYKIKDLNIKKISNVKSVELTIFDLEVEAINKNGELQFYYKKLLYDFYNCFFFENNTRVDDLKMTYGYTFTCYYDIKNEKDFEEYLKENSLLYYKIWQFLKLDMKKVDINIDIIKVLKDNKYCIELSLLSAVQWMRFYVNFPVGDLAKYVKNVHDRNFLGAFSSLPTDYKTIQTTTIRPLGIGYYYVFYKLHLDYFNSISIDEFIENWRK